MPQPDCTFCSGTGWRLVDRVEAGEVAQRVVDGTGEPSQSGQSGRKLAGASSAAPPLKWAVPCDCAGGDRTSRALVRARVPRRYEHCDFENFATDFWEGSPTAQTWNRSLAQAKLTVEGFARNYPAANETGLLLMGPSGVGKTHLAVAALRELMSRGHLIRFCDYRELLKEIQASYNPDHPATEMHVLAPVLEAEILLIDDVGASKPSDWALDTIGHILNQRYNDKRLTLLTTNYLDGPESAVNSATVQLPSGQPIAASREPTLAERLGQRVRSRLYEMCRTIEIVSADFRREIRHAGPLRR